MRINFDNLPAFNQNSRHLSPQSKYSTATKLTLSQFPFLSPQQQSMNNSRSRLSHKNNDNNNNKFNKTGSNILIQIQSPIYSKINKSINEQNYQQEISKLNQVIEMPIEVSRFIQREVQKEIVETNSRVKANERENGGMKMNVKHTQQKQKMNERMDPNKIRKQNKLSQQTIKIMNDESKSKSKSKNKNIQHVTKNNPYQITKKTMKLKNIIKSLYQNLNNNNKTLKTTAAKQKPEQNKKTLINKPKRFHTQKADVNYQNHKQEPKPKNKPSYIPTQVRQTLDDISQLTCHPMLYSCATSARIETLRKTMRKQNNISTHQSLYFDAIYRQRKLQMQLTIQNQEAMNRYKPKINQKYYSKNGNNSKYISLHSRLDQILQNREDKRRQKESMDLASGREMFQPNLRGSQQSYKIFMQSLSKQKIVVNKKKKPQLTYTKFSDTSMNTVSNIKTTKKQKQNKIDTKTIEYFLSIFYPQAPLHISSVTSMNKMRNIKKQQFLILHSFIHEIQQLESKKYQMQTTVSSVKLSGSSATQRNNSSYVLSREQFQQRFRKFYEGLNMHDRQILRKQILESRRKQIKKNQQQNQVQKNTYRPKINIRSASMDNLSKSYDKLLYYV